MLPRDTAPGGNFTVHRTTGEITEVNKSLGRLMDDLHMYPLWGTMKQITFVCFKC